MKTNQEMPFNNRRVIAKALPWQKADHEIKRRGILKSWPRTYNTKQPVEDSLRRESATDAVKVPLSLVSSSCTATGIAGEVGNATTVEASQQHSAQLDRQISHPTFILLGKARGQNQD